MTDKIGPGHVCPHGIRWPWACEPCDQEAWEQHKREQEAARATHSERTER